MGRSNKTSSTVEAKSNDTLTGYLQRAGSFAYISIMVIIYLTLIAIFSPN